MRRRQIEAQAEAETNRLIGLYMNVGESESDSDDRRYDHISGKVIKLRRKSSKVDDRLEYNRAKTLRILNFAYND